ncbi:MAG: hypothetical protein ACTTI3_08420 [Treponema sp.]
MKNGRLRTHDGRWKDIIFFGSDGQKAENAIYYAEDAHTGEVVFYELLGMSGIDGIPYLKLNGKNVYRRLLIRRVFPYMLKEKCTAAGNLDEETEYETVEGSIPQEGVCNA